MGFCPVGVLFCDQKSTRKVPLLPRRGARLKGAWVRAAHERFASAPLRIQERTDWPLPGANTLQPKNSQFLLLVSYFWTFVGGDACIAPFWPRRGQCGGGRKSVKKNAALLHFLAFPSNDHLFGVPRGLAPWAGPPARSEVAGTFFASFLGVQKGRTSG